MLDKKAALFERDEKGELIPKEVELVVDENDKDQKTLKGEKIWIVPLLRGEVRRMFSDLGQKDADIDKDLDGELIVSNCKKPAFTLEETKYLKGYVASAIVNTILFHSGLDVGRPRRKAMQTKEDEFKKN